MAIGASVRRSLLGRRHRRDRDESSGPADLRVIESRAGSSPVLGSELEVPVTGPLREAPEQVPEVGLGSRSWSLQEAMREKTLAAASAWSSLPTKSHAFLPWRVVLNMRRKPTALANISSIGEASTQGRPPP